MLTKIAREGLYHAFALKKMCGFYPSSPTWTVIRLYTGQLQIQDLNEVLVATRNKMSSNCTETVPNYSRSGCTDFGSLSI